MRILLDTNVLPEIRKSKHNDQVLEHVKKIGSDNIYLSSITIGEIACGISRLDQGRKRQDLTAWLSHIENQYHKRILPIDTDTARMWGEITAKCQAKGRSLSPADGLIAATALRHGLHVMTRNVKDFESTGVILINPWEE